MLDGDGHPTPGRRRAPAPRRPDGRAPGRHRVAHQFRAGAAGMTLLASGHSDPRDIAFYPRIQQGASCAGWA